MKQLIHNRLVQLRGEVQERSKHKNPMYYTALNNLRWCSIVDALLNDQAPSGEDVNAVCGIKQARTTNPTSVSKVDLTPYIKDGAKVMDILDKYRDTIPDIHEQLRGVVQKMGYHIDGFYIRANGVQCSGEV